MRRLPEPRYKVVLREEKRKHFYDVTSADGTKATLPGVTGVLGVIAKPALIPWATRTALERVEEVLRARLNGDEKRRITLDAEWIASLIAEARKRPTKIKEDAADLGTQAHQWIDAFIRATLAGETVPANVPKPIEPAINAFFSWLKQTDLEIIAGDTKVASLEYGFGGSLDALAVKPDGTYVLLDWKSSSGIWPEYALQVAAYEVALFETYGIGAKQLSIVRFSKVEPVEFEVKTVASSENAYAAFAAAKELQKRMGVTMFVEDQEPAHV